MIIAVTIYFLFIKMISSINHRNRRDYFGIYKSVCYIYETITHIRHEEISIIIRFIF
jgi:hypothetical protein